MTWREVLPYLIVTFLVGVGAKYGPRILNGDRKQVEATAASIANDAALKAMKERQDQQSEYLNSLNGRVVASEKETQAYREIVDRLRRDLDDAEDYIDELTRFLRGVTTLEVPVRRRRVDTTKKEAESPAA